jgi:CubicO group peptidase (beta-lactamase class C family)
MMPATEHSGIHGYVSNGFETVRDAFLDNFSRRKELGAACCVYRHATLYPRSNIYRALITNPGAAISLDTERIYSRNLEVPSGGGVGTARAIAHAYSVFATGGRELQLRPETLQLLTAPAVPPERGFYDQCMKGEIRFSFGFCKPGPTSPFGHPGSFGHPGAGGSFGFADPEVGIGYAYVTNRMGTTLPFDPRDVALRNVLSLIST